MNKIKCPHCDYEFTDDDMESSSNDLWGICPNEEDVKEDCPACKDYFWIMGSYVQVYRTFKNWEELELA